MTVAGRAVLNGQPVGHGQPMRIGLVAATLAMVSVLAACGGSSNPKETTGSSTTATTAPDPRVDKDRAQKIALTDSNVPGGFSQTGVAKETERDADYHQLAVCVGANDDPSLETVDWSGADFEKDNNSIGSEVAFSKASADTRADLNVLKSQKARHCIRDYIDKTLRARIGTAASLTTTVVNVDGLEGPETSALRGTTNIRANGAIDVMYFDLITSVVDRAVLSADYVWVGSEPPLDVESTNIETMRQRARDALGLK